MSGFKPKTKIIHTNTRIEVRVEEPTFFSNLETTEIHKQRILQAYQETVDSIKRHIDDWESVRIESDETTVCAHCEEEHEIVEPDDNLDLDGCCADAMQDYVNWEKEQTK